MLSMHLLAIKIESRIYLSFTKAFLKPEIMFPNANRSLLANTLAISL